MKSFKIVFSVLVILMTVAIMQPAAAQARHKPRKVKVVKVNHVRVVKAHPHVYKRAHIRYAALPRWGTVVATYPAAAVLVRFGGSPFYFYNGIYYAPRQNSYVIVRPVRGVRIRTLPVGYRRILVGPRPYFYYYGTFYVQAGSRNEYIVTDPPEGAIVDALPDGYEIKTVNGNEYYELDGVYYAEVDASDIDGGIGYQVVKI